MPFQGVIPPVITPHQADGTIDENRFRTSLRAPDCQGRAGCRCRRHNGENTTRIPREERLRLIALGSRSCCRTNSVFCRLWRAAHFGVCRLRRSRAHRRSRWTSGECTCLFYSDTVGVGDACADSGSCRRFADYALQLSRTHRRNDGCRIP